MKNQSLADIFNRMGVLLEIQGENVFKVRAYHKAADNISQLGEDIQTLKDQGRLGDIPGIGKALQDKISEYLDTGGISAYERILDAVPETLLDVVHVPSVGPKKAKLFFDRLHIQDIAGLESAARSGAMLGLPGIKDKTVNNILEGIRIFRAAQSRMTLDEAFIVALYFVDQLKTLPQVSRAEIAGSLRRRKESIRDIDILAESREADRVMDVFVGLPAVESVQARGETKSSVLARDHIQVDLRVVDSDCFGAALLYLTGSKNFNIALRQIAIKQKKKISEYGVFSAQGPVEKKIAGTTEEECFAALGLPYVPPELREDIGLDHILKGAENPAGLQLPDLIQLKDIKGDLHVHSLWSDGRCSIRDLAQAAVAKGYEYIGISDHSVSLKVAGGLGREDLKKKKLEIDALNKEFKNLRILFGTEVEIDADGNIDYPDEILSQFDIVIAAIHNGFEQGRVQLTQRIIKACHNDHVHVIAHPTGFHKGKREAYDIDFEAVCDAAVSSRTCLEINAFPVRLDLNAVNVHFARGKGVSFVINTDAHDIGHLDYMKYGLAVARRGWLTKQQVLNTLSLKDLLKVLHK